MIDDNVRSILKYLVSEMQIRITTMSETLEDANCERDPKTTDRETRAIMRKAMSVIDSLDSLGVRVTRFCEDENKK